MLHALPGSSQRWLDSLKRRAQVKLCSEENHSHFKKKIYNQALPSIPPATPPPPFKVFKVIEKYLLLY